MPLCVREAVALGLAIYLPGQLCERHKCGLTPLADGPFSFSEPRVVEDFEKRAPREPEEGRVAVGIRAKSEPLWEMEKVVMFRVPDGLLASDDERIRDGFYIHA